VILKDVKGYHPQSGQGDGLLNFYTRNSYSNGLNRRQRVLHVMMMDMRRLFAIIGLVVSLGAVVLAQDITTLEKIGPVVSLQKTGRTVTFTCEDSSQVQLTILAPDLIRVRAAFTKPIPAKDQSWAIAKETWDTPRWSLKESEEAVTISTDEVEVVVRRSPLLIEFRDAHSHKLINADEQPMSYDAKGRLAGLMFDPKSGMFVAASKKLGFDEHFYGLGEKAARLEPRYPAGNPVVTDPGTPWSGGTGSGRRCGWCC